MRYCTSSGSVVDALRWLPAEPYDYAWPRGPVIGCNHLRCARCNTQVTTSLTRSTLRTYACRCVSQDISNHQILDADYEGYRGLAALDDPAPVGLWACAGHPALPVPSVLDGIRISPEHFREIARFGFASPPFLPPQASQADWVWRLYWIIPDALRPALHQVIFELLSDDEPWVIRGALDFCRGDERLIAYAREHRSRLATIADSHNPNLTLEDVLLLALESQLGDPEVNTMLRETLFSGSNLAVADDVIYTFGRDEPDWLAANAAAIAKHAPSLVSAIVFLLWKYQPAEDKRVAAFRAIAALGPGLSATLLAHIDDRFGRDAPRIRAALGV